MAKIYSVKSINYRLRYVFILFPRNPNQQESWSELTLHPPIIYIPLKESDEDISWVHNKLIM